MSRAVTKAELQKIIEEQRETLAALQENEAQDLISELQYRIHKLESNAEESTNEIEALNQENDRLKGVCDDMIDLIDRCEKQMSEAGWHRYDSSNAMRECVYREAKERTWDV